MGARRDRRDGPVPGRPRLGLADCGAPGRSTRAVNGSVAIRLGHTRSVPRCSLRLVNRAEAPGAVVRTGAGVRRRGAPGARLTAWELQRSGVPTTLITDNMAGHFMAKGAIQSVVVGADRIASNGDTIGGSPTEIRD
ncbi:MAG: hypothetical protein EXR72_12805 [Myxococcales bacterium]|nr:hypothetical protein [Myxococcales bacterium]